MELQMRLIETTVGDDPVWVIQSFRNGAWDVDIRTWDTSHCGYIRSYETALKRFEELTNPKKPKVIKEATVRYDDR